VTPSRPTFAGLVGLIGLAGILLHPMQAFAQQPTTDTTSATDAAAPSDQDKANQGQVVQGNLIPVVVSNDCPEPCRAPLTPAGLLTVTPQQKRSSVMTTLYVWTAGMQVLDTHSTLTAHQYGLEERNPLMRELAKSPPAFIAVKAGVTAGVIYLADKSAKHNKVATIVALVGANVAYAFIVSHNYKIRPDTP
jgi:hypothetical protein